MDIVPTRVQTGQHDQLVFEGRQRLQNWRQLEPWAFALWRPVLHRHPIGDIERLKAVCRLRSREAPQRESWVHSIEKG